MINTLKNKNKMHPCATCKTKGRIHKTKGHFCFCKECVEAGKMQAFITELKAFYNSDEITTFEPKARK